MEADPFMIRAHVPNWEANVADYRHASEATRRTNRDCRTVAYGEHADEKLDLYFPVATQPAELRPIHLFVHGGYWRAFSKDDYAFIADAITDAGAVAAIMDYSLMPAARMDVLVGQVRCAARWLEIQAKSFGGDPHALSASGHSAGAHLASFLACRAAHETNATLASVRSVLLVSGIYDLDPITRSFLQPELQFTEMEVVRWSPLNSVPARSTTIAVLVGERETAPFRDQAAAFVQHLQRSNIQSRLATMKGEDHMTIVRELGLPGSACARYLKQTIGAFPPTDAV